MKIYLNAIFLFALTVIGLTGCTTMTDEELMAAAKKNLANPAKRLTITVTSEPSGASVFGVKPGMALLLQEAQPGAYLGKTPLTLTYTRVGGAIFGSLPDETLVIKETDASPISDAHASLKFNCMLMMDGYQRFTVSDMIEEESNDNDPLGQARLKSFDRGISKTYNATLVQGEVEHAELKTTLGTITQGGDIAAMTKPVVKTGRVSFVSTPDSAEIFIDGAFMGNTPSSLPLEEGEHKIEVKLGGFKPYARTLKVVSGAEVTLKAVLETE